MALIYNSTEDFYAERGGRYSGELDFGVWWVDGDDPARGPRYRVSLVHDTGDIYATSPRLGTVELLGSLWAEAELCAERGVKHPSTCVYSIAEVVFEGWAEGGPRSITWARERIAERERSRDGAA